MPELRPNRKLRFHADSDDVVQKSDLRKSPLISSQPVSGPRGSAEGLKDYFRIADYMDTIARGSPVVVPNVLLFREIAPP
jgi:hypothetical protein